MRFCRTLCIVQGCGTASHSRWAIAFRSTPFHLSRAVPETPVNTSTVQQHIRSAPALTCPRCQGPVNVGSRHVAVDGPAIHVYCSEACLQGGLELAGVAGLVGLG